MGDVKIIGYESLVRSRVKGLETPDKIFRSAALRSSEIQLSEVCRSEGLLSGIRLGPLSCFFLNTHAAELETPRLLESLKELRANFPALAIVLEIHEAAITSMRYLTELAALPTDLNIDLAYDDFGAGHARLVKFDISFVRGLENASRPHKASILALLNMVHELDVTAIAEGVETQTQADICTEFGFDMAQGYFFGRPQRQRYWRDAERTDVKAKSIADAPSLAAMQQVLTTACNTIPHAVTNVSIIRPSQPIRFSPIFSF
jgi:EAL domain-containing protein (putative c-di-GMP-specific phosphodiesterase class I)